VGAGTGLERASDLVALTEQAPALTVFCAGAAIALFLSVLVFSHWRQRRWSRAADQLQALRAELATTAFETMEHRGLFARSEALLGEVETRSGNYPNARRLLVGELFPVVTTYHRGAASNSGGEWEELSGRVLERWRFPIRLARAAASWVVLLGLAGTVAGFLEALPAFRGVIVAPLANQESPRASTGEQPPEDGELQVRASAGHGQLGKALSSLYGVFIATFVGVVCALLLYLAVTLMLEPSFERFAVEVEGFGRRWFCPLLNKPTHFIDDELRTDLSGYFEVLGKQLTATLSPFVEGLRARLLGMSELAEALSKTMVAGQTTIVGFQEAVEKLRDSAAASVARLTEITTLSGDFLREVRSLQDAGRRQLEWMANAIAGPAQELAESAAALETRVSSLDSHLSGLATAVSEDAAAVRERARVEEDLGRRLGDAAKALENQATVTSRASRILADVGPQVAVALGDRLGTPLESLDTSLQGLTREQQQVAQKQGHLVDALGTTAGALDSCVTGLSQVPTQLQAAVDAGSRDVGDRLESALESCCRSLAGVGGPEHRGAGDKLAQAATKLEETMRRMGPIADRLADASERLLELPDRLKEVVTSSPAVSSRTSSLHESRVAPVDSSEVIGSIQSLRGEVRALRDEVRSKSARRNRWPFFDFSRSPILKHLGLSGPRSRRGS